MKPARAISISVVALSAVVCLFSAYIIRENRAASHDLQANTPSSAGTPSPDYAYVLGVSNGKISVFAPNETEPLEILDVYVSTLPEYDQLELKSGLKIKDEEELKRRLEDFES